MKMQIQLMKMQIQLKRHRYFCKYTVLPLEWHPPNTNSIDKNTNTIDEDAITIAANTQIFLQIQNPLPLEWHPPNTNPIDKNTNTIDEDANTQIFLQIHSSSTRLAPSKYKFN